MSGEELLRLEGITKSFGSVEVLRGLELSVGRGEFITLLGSSGCGKTTLLRIIAGLETMDAGRVFIDGNDVSGFAPDKRGANMVFQNYALFPHMNVEQNIGYSLKLRGLPRAEIKNAVADALSLVRLSGFERRRPDELSGGQRQRVSVARAVINRPKVLLLDEPLGALDLQLRRQMQIELKRLQMSLGITFVYITHDQEEALTMSDRLAVIRGGVVEQVDSPAAIYKSPKTAYVARFVGGANLFRDGAGGKCFAVREENMVFRAAGGTSGGGLAAVVTGKYFAGGLLRVTARLKNGGGPVVLAGENGEISGSSLGMDAPFEIGDEVLATWLPENAVSVDCRE